MSKSLYLLGVSILWFLLAIVVHVSNGDTMIYLAIANVWLVASFVSGFDD